MVNTATTVVAAIGWVLIGLLSGIWMARRGFDALWILLAAPLGPLFVPIAIERVRRRPDSADATPAESLPAGTGPNAIAWSTGRIALPRLVKAGFALDVAGIFLIVGVVFALAPLVA